MKQTPVIFVDFGKGQSAGGWDGQILQDDDGSSAAVWTDGVVNHISSLSFSSAGSRLTITKLPPGQKATTGYATLVGDDLMHLKIIDAGVHSDDPAPYQGRYP